MEAGFQFESYSKEKQVVAYKTWHILVIYQSAIAMPQNKILKISSLTRNSFDLDFNLS